MPTMPAVHHETRGSAPQSELRKKSFGQQLVSAIAIATSLRASPNGIYPRSFRLTVGCAIPVDVPSSGALSAPGFIKKQNR
jgi:hypothetical protein